MPANVRYALFMSLLVFIGVVGLIVIVMLMGAWRRHLGRQKRKREAHLPPPADIWQVSGQRLGAPPKDEDPHR